MDVSVKQKCENKRIKTNKEKRSNNEKTKSAYWGDVQSATCFYVIYYTTHPNNDPG